MFPMKKKSVSMANEGKRAKEKVFKKEKRKFVTFSLKERQQMRNIMIDLNICISLNEVG